MSVPSSPQREKELQEFIQRTAGTAYSRRIILWFQQNLKQVVTSEELARIPGKDGKPISHNIRRVFELRDELGYKIVNHKNNAATGLNLRVDAWVLLESYPDPSKIRDRGVNKRIRMEVFERDMYMCTICGRTPEDDDPYSSGRKIKLHVGHKLAHKRDEAMAVIPTTELTSDDFVTMCNVCNEGLKNKDFKSITILDRVRNLSLAEKKKILEQLQKDIST